LEVHLRKAYRVAPEAGLRELGVETELTGRTIGRWERGTREKPQPQYPADPWSREALVAVVTALVPVAPVEVEWASFRKVCEEFIADRLERIERGSGILDSYAVQERNKERHQFLAAWPTTAGGIDPVALGLGSWAFNGAPPPYVHRTADARLARQLEVPGITTVLGAPKSGKSRSVLEVLQRHYSSALTWWVNPSPSVLPLVLENAKKAKINERPAFVVLDDAGLIGTDPAGGLTAQRLHDLAAVCTKLVVIVHDETFADWEQQLTDHTGIGSDSPGSGATWELIDLIRNGVRYDSVLDDRETTPAAQAYDGADLRLKNFDLARFAESLAGVDMLRDKARKILASATSVEAALIEAAIDTSIVFPTGATPETLGSLAKEYYRQRQPNRPWRSNLLADAFDTVTTGITAGSPHAILITTGSSKYRLLDALAPELLHPDRDPLSVLKKTAIPEALLIKAVDNVAVWHYRNGRLVQARRMWNSQAAAGDTRAMLILGALALKVETDTEIAREWWERAANAGHDEAMYRLGELSQLRGKSELAQQWWERAAASGHVSAMYRLGVMTKTSGHPESARYWWTRAGHAGHAQAMNELGGLFSLKGDTMSAREWWERAANTGDPQAMYNVGVIAKEEGDSEAAVAWWTRAADAKHAGAAYVLGRIANRIGDTEGARAWFEQAAKPVGSVHAVEKLVGLAEDRGDDADAQRWRERLTEERRVKTQQLAEAERVRAERRTSFDRFHAKYWGATRATPPACS